MATMHGTAANAGSKGAGIPGAPESRGPGVS
jgi:hypothetical protein